MNLFTPMSQETHTIKNDHHTNTFAEVLVAFVTFPGLIYFGAHRFTCHGSFSRFLFSSFVLDGFLLLALFIL